MDEHVQLARAAIEAWCATKQIIAPEDIPENFLTPAGCFVSLWQGETLRGCIGTIVPMKSNIAEEIIANTIAAAAKDPRYKPINANELETLSITIDIMHEPEKIESITDCDPKLYGIIVEKGSQLGLMLPDMPGVRSIQDQLEQAMRKANILDGLYGCNLYRFTTERHREE